MAYKSLREFFGMLESAGELKRVAEPVSTHLEMTEIGHRLIANGGPAALLEKPSHADGRASEMPALVNLFGTVKRVAMAVTMDGKARTTAPDLREVGELLAFLRQPEPPRGLKDALDLLPLAQDRDVDAPEDGEATAPCQEIVLTGDDIDLDRLPIQTCWPGDVGAADHLAADRHQGPVGFATKTTTISASTACRSSTRTRTIMRWLAHRGGAQHYRRWKAEKPEPLPAAAVIGADPGMILAAVTPVPDTLSEYQFAGLLRGPEGRSRAVQNRAAESAGRSRDRARRPCHAR